MGNINQAAYVPMDDYTDWDDAVALAVAWIEEQCEAEGSAGLLVTHTVGGASYTPRLQRFVQRHRNHATPRSQSARRSPGTGPALVYVPDAPLLHLANHFARNSALCVVEGSFGVAGWAAATQAVNLVEGHPTPEVDDEVEHELERLLFYGNNGWGNNWGKQQAKKIVPGLLRKLSPRVDANDFIVGWVIANGASDYGAKNLQKIISTI